MCKVKLKMVGKQQTKKQVKKVSKVAKKPQTKRQTKKPQQKKEKQQKSITHKNRHFSIIYEGKKLKATPSGKRPKQAAQKALTAIFKMLKQEGKDISKLYDTDIKFVLYENGKRRKNKKGEYVPRRIFRYTGKRSELPSSSIKREIITYCDTCQKKIEELQKDNITKKQFNTNLKSLKRYLKLKKEEQDKFEMHEHLKKHLEEYKAILECTKCKKEIKEIEYKFSNSVKKTDEKTLTAEDKKITPEFVEELEMKEKETKKKEEGKKEPAKKVEKKKEDKNPVEKKPAEKKETKKQTPKKK